MKQISNKKYQEYEQLKKWRDLQEVRDSVHSVTKLEDDIDLPIRNVVALIALTGCTPLFSCCGFDYEGQHLHKCHQYGEPYVMIRADQRCNDVLGAVWTRLSGGFILNYRSNLVYLEQKLPYRNPHWDSPSCIHYSEESVIGLSRLEKSIITQLKDYMLDEVILTDTNSQNKKNNPHWQYPPKSDWVISKSAILENIEK